jgi:hypothetical protein
MKEEAEDDSPKDTTSPSKESPKEKKVDKEVLEIEYPRYWEPQESDHQMFPVKEGSMEYNSIVDRFHESMPKVKVTKVLRNQNRRLWMWYLLKKMEVSKKAKHGANEKVYFVTLLCY